jgi:rhodanese-related sulfurtransferase
MLPQSIRETFLLIGAAAILGTASTYVTKQVFFSENKSAPQLEMLSLEKVKELYESKNVLFIDARHEFEYTMGHIRGALNIGLKEIETHQHQLDDIPKEKLLVVYCDGTDCNSSLELGIKLMEWGFTNVKIFFGGWQEWKTNNLPIDP